MNTPKTWLAENTNLNQDNGSPVDVLEDADVFIGLSGPGIIDADDLQRMHPDPFVFAMANPNPEVSPEAAERYAGVMATGRSDYPNQINNVLVFPGLFRGALDVRATAITEDMELAAARALADVVEAEHLEADYVIPSVFDRRVAPAVAAAVSAAAEVGGVARREASAGFPHVRSVTSPMAPRGSAPILRQ